MKMIKYEHSTKRDGAQVYYYHRDVHYFQAIVEQGSSLRRLAHTIYDVNAQRFTKERLGNDELMNALLLVKRNRHRITDEMMELVNEHA